jgi:hypothetical protein
MSTVTTPPRHSRLKQIVVGAVIAGLVACAFGAWLAFRDPPPPATHTVLYEVEADAATGSGRTGSYTIRTDTGGTSQGTGKLPMTGTYTFRTGDFVYVSVQNGQPAGTVTCRITVDGVKLAEVTSNGAFTIATCQGKVP